MTPEDRTKLRELAEKTTPGPWGLTYGPNERTRLWSDADGYTDDVIALDPTTERGKPHPDMAFIAAVDPSTLLALLDALDDSVPKSWAGLLEILEDAYPEYIFPTLADDPGRDAGPRIISLIRELDATRARLAETEAAIARVRELALPTGLEDTRAREDYLWASDILRALDGDERCAACGTDGGSDYHGTWYCANPECDGMVD